MAGSIASGKNPGNTATKDGAETLTNKVLVDPTIEDGVDSTKKVTVDTSNVTTGTTRNIKMPDANDTLVGKATTDTLTNKSIDAATNTVTGLSHGTEVDNPTTGVHGVTGNVVGTSDAQVITNKDIDGGTASNTNRVTVPSNTKASLDALTRKAGTVVYASDKKKMYKDDGSSLKELGGGAGSPSVYKILNTDDDDIANWINTGTGTFTFTAVNPYNGDTSYNFATAAQNDQLKFIMPVPLRSQGITNSVTMNYESSAIGAELVMYDETNAAEIERFILPVTTKIEKVIVPFIVKSTATSISFRIENTHLTNTPVVKFDDIIFSDDPFTYKNLLEEGYININVGPKTYINGNGLRYNYPFSASDLVNGNSFFSNVTDGIQFNKNCNISATFSISTSSSGDMFFELFDSNNNPQTDYSVFSKSSTGPWAEVSVNLAVTKGQILKFVINGFTAGATAATNTRITLHAQAESAHVITPVKSNMTDWQSYTPVVTGLGIVNPNTAKWRRVGGNIFIEGKFTTGTVSSQLVSISLPILNGTQLTKDTSKLITDHMVGRTYRDTTGNGNTDYSITHIASMATNVVGMGVFNRTGQTPLTAYNGTGLFLNNETGGYSFSVPIVGWTSDVQILGAMPKRRVAIVVPSSTQKYYFILATLAFKTVTLDHLEINSDSSFVSVGGNQLTLEKGRYLIDIPVGSYAGSNSVTLQLYNITDNSQYYNYSQAAYSELNVISWNTVKVIVDIPTSKTFEIRTGSNTGVGYEYVSSITIEKLE